MPLIPNYISRFRTHSQSTTTTGSSTNISSESRSASTFEPHLTEASTINSTALHPIEELDRKINPDLDPLPAETDANAPRVGSTSPVTSQPQSKSAIEVTTEEQSVQDTSRHSQVGQGSVTSKSSRSEAKSSNNENVQAMLPNWATFGRKGVPVMTRINEFASRYRRESSSPSTQQTAPSSPAPTPHSSSQASPSPAGTASSGSRTYSQRSHPARSRPSKPFADIGSNTFGRTSRRPTTDGGQTTDYNDNSAAADLFTPTRTSTPPPPERLARQPPWTYPPRSRKRSLPKGGSVSFPTLVKRRSRRSVDEVFRGLDGNQRVNADVPIAAALTAQASSSPGNAGDGNTQQEGKRKGKMESVDGEFDATAKNPSFFGSVGRDRQAFLRASRTKVMPTYEGPETSLLSPPEEPESIPSTVLVSVGDASSLPTTLLPGVSRSGPLPGSSAVVEGNNASDSKFPSSGSTFGITDMAASSAKRKMLDSQDDVTAQASSSGTKGILLNPKRESNRVSDASHAPSSFRKPKRIRLSTPGASSSSSPPMRTRSLSPNNPNLSPPNSPTSMSRPPSSLRSFSSQASSIPVRAIVSPKPPSIVSGHSAYHMRDPVLPPSKRESTQWTGAARTKLDLGEQAGRVERMFPLQAWAFVTGFVLFPIWWIAAVMPVKWGWAWTQGRGPQDGKGKRDGEDTVRETLEHDVAYTWRKRCRIMSVVGLLVYIPLIVLLAVFVPRAEA